MKDKKEKKILQAALNLFIERGFHDTPTSLIAKKADVATGTLFHYFKSKEDLINELYLDAKNSLFQELIKEIGEETPDEEKLELLWMNLVKCGLKSPREFKFYQQFGGVKDYNAFLELFELKDSIESKDKYINFVDNIKRFLEIRGDWRVDEILQNPDKFLDKVKIGEKRKK